LRVRKARSVGHASDKSGLWRHTSSSYMLFMNSETTLFSTIAFSSLGSAPTARKVSATSSACEELPNERERVMKKQHEEPLPAIFHAGSISKIYSLFGVEPRHVHLQEFSQLDLAVLVACNAYTAPHMRRSDPVLPVPTYLPVDRAGRAGRAPSSKCSIICLISSSVGFWPNERSMNASSSASIEPEPGFPTPSESQFAKRARMVLERSVPGA
jgi:hypothetical protein